MFCVNAACLVLTFSRGGWIGLLASILPSLVLLSMVGVTFYLFFGVLVAANSLVSMSLLLLAVLFESQCAIAFSVSLPVERIAVITSALMSGQLW